MISFNTFNLKNGLRVVVHEDPTVEVAVLNLLYDVGSRDESPEKTGFAHLFEHLMFGGSSNIPDFDSELQKVGGENNAFTNPDVTNYYMTLPAQSLETGFWLESDRMLGLSFEQKVLEVQRKVVIEEFKQRYLNQPYGDVWLKLRPLVYQKHPYNWPTIGKEIRHIEEATLQDVRDFFFKHYRPDQAILVIAGNVSTDEVRKMAEKWFGPIPRGAGYRRDLPAEPPQQRYQREVTDGDVPADALFLCFHVPGRYDDYYHAADLLSDILGRGKSARLYSQLVREKKLFSQINSYMTGSIDPGLLVINGHLNEGIGMEEAEKAVFDLIAGLETEEITARELEKVKNQAMATVTFGEVEVLQRAMNLAFATLHGDTEEVNRETGHIEAVTLEDLDYCRKNFLRHSNCSALFYRSKKNTA